MNPTVWPQTSVAGYQETCQVSAITLIFPVLNPSGMELIELLVLGMKKAPKKLLQLDRLVQALCHKFCSFSIFGSRAFSALDSRSSRHFEPCNPAEPPFQSVGHISTQEDSCAGVLEVFRWEGETCIS
jgi:hypothetical protein